MDSPALLRHRCSHWPCCSCCCKRGRQDPLEGTVMTGCMRMQQRDLQAIPWALQRSFTASRARQCRPGCMIQRETFW